jgi:Uma2 family endonuclease
MVAKKTRFTIAEYLDLEFAAEDRSEYYDGKIVEKGHDNWDHGTICVNLIGLIGSYLKGSDTRIVHHSLKVYSGLATAPDDTARGVFTYPDFVIINGEPRIFDKRQHVVTNTAALIEVLSPETERLDRGKKFHQYQKWSPTLTDYVLVSSDISLVMIYTRRTDESWTCGFASGLDESLTIPSISCTLKLADIYDRIVFAEEPSEAM